MSEHESARSTKRELKRSSQIQKVVRDDTTGRSSKITTGR
jgi:hypothetical protein